MKHYLHLLTQTTYAITLIVVLGLLVYGNALFNNFIGDDFGQVVNNPLVHSLSNIPSLFAGSTFYDDTGAFLHGNYYRPLMSTMYAVIYTLFGPTPFFFHLFQVALHITNSILLLFLFRKFFNKPIGLGLSLLFLVHPVNSEAVNSISALQDLLFPFFGLLALQVTIVAKDSWKKVGGVSVLLLCSLLSKETGILFIPVILLSIFLYDRRKIFLYSLSFLVIALLCVILRMSALGLTINTDQIAPIMYLSLEQRLMHIPLLLVSYFNVFFFPKDLAYLQIWVLQDFTLYNFYLPLLMIGCFVLLLIAGGYRLSKKARRDFHLYVFFISWIVLGLALHLQLIPLDMTFSERWFYFPEIGLLGLLGIVAKHIQVTSEGLQKLLVIIFIGIVIVFSLRTMWRNTNWYDLQTLATHDLRIRPDNYIFHGKLGNQLEKNGRYDEAEVHLKKSLALYPPSLHHSNSYLYRWNDLCVNYALRGQKNKNDEDLEKSVQCFKNALEKKFYPGLSLKLGKVLLNQNKLDEAEYYLELTTKHASRSADAFYVLAEVKYKLKKTEEALEAAKKSYTIKKNVQAARLYKQIMEEKDGKQISH